ncbi:hypothetical protein CN138_21790 [Sinorhizobium meliloti]|jgi:hypothetical protein|uniref:Uncharacterized protein n=1 Tax=Sinorhizobium meliloti CCNWSX0020 TaxID=1107881 RepID=H0G7X5_RHIML|nr:hypothetical protein Sinme_1213 [Sinorhizobium meliloti AK83]ASP76812.1 hypothetical protein CDO27_01585 [Sinorhizobium meliloti]EHK74566.1 hypothetical protein SM0020_28050 [Sinorhizobium meliloti CCNWSX0020]PII38849.1 hypothetical protein T190_15155 [Sinorhizobium meliloti CCBAU 01290]ASP84594.1 hypothetical protein CDO26_08290 [Sinorhizobium meliloti]
MQQSKCYSDLCASDKTLQSLLTLISVRVTEIQQRCVCGAGKCSFSPRTWSDWIPVTSTGMRRSSRGGYPGSQQTLEAALASADRLDQASALA